MTRIVRENGIIKLRIGGKDEWKTADKVDRRLEAEEAEKEKAQKPIADKIR